MIKVTGLQLIAAEACVEGKRLFLAWAGVVHDHLADSEIDLVLAGLCLQFPPQGAKWEPADWAALLNRVVATPFAGWIFEEDRFGLLAALAPHAGVDQVQQALLSLLRDDDWAVREAAAVALAPHAGAEALQQALLSLLRDPSSVGE